MADEKKSFNELLSEAPLAAKEDTISLVGALERSLQPGKFVLILGAGRTLTLEVEAVKAYRVLGGAVGQQLVEVDLDRNKVPRELTESQAAQARHLRTVLELDVGREIKLLEDNYRLKYVVENPGTLEETLQEGIGPSSYGGDPEWRYGGYYAGQVAAPFALATPHQVSSATIAAMQPGWLSPYVTAPRADKPILDEGGTRFGRYWD